MRNNLATFLAAGLFLFGSAAIAQQTTQDKLYVEAGVTYIKADLGVGETSGNNLTITVDDTDTAPILVVGFKVADNLALEAGIIGKVDVGISVTANYNGSLYGRTVVANGRLDVTGEGKESYMLGGAFTIPVNDKFDLVARAGVMWWDVDYYLSANVAGTVNGTAFAVNQKVFLQSADGADPYFGVGATYKFTKNWALKADYLRTKIDDADVDSMSLRISYLY
jgi:long-subunit fatty acid transport protein